MMDKYSKLKLTDKEKLHWVIIDEKQDSYMIHELSENFIKLKEIDKDVVYSKNLEKEKEYDKSFCMKIHTALLDSDNKFIPREKVKELKNK